MRPCYVFFYIKGRILKKMSFCKQSVDRLYVWKLYRCRYKVYFIKQHNAKRT